MNPVWTFPVHDPKLPLRLDQVPWWWLDPSAGEYPLAR